MDIRQMITDTEAQIARLHVRLEVLREMAGEVGTVGRGRRRGPGRARASAQAATTTSKPRGRASGKRAGRGANQERVLSILTTTDTRASELARQVGLPQQSVTQVLKALIKKGKAVNTGRGLYRLTGGGGSAPSGGDGEARAPRAARNPKGSRTPGRSLRRVSEEAQEPGPQEEVIDRSEPIEATVSMSPR